jgi:uncharacterized protein (DUF3820 family)
MDSTPHPIPEQKTSSCLRCGGELIEVTLPTGPHHAELRCSVCARHIKFLPAPWTRHRAATFRMPFGTHAGKTLAELAQTKSGREYLAWMANQLEGNPGIAARILLDHATEARL